MEPYDRENEPCPWWAWLAIAGGLLAGIGLNLLTRLL